MIDPGLDVLVGGGLVWLAWSLLRDPDLVRAAMTFIVFGLLLALAWVRLDAPDIALAEAAIGAGVTGVIVLDAARSLPRPPVRAAWPAAAPAAALAALAGVGVAGAIVAMPDGSPGLAPLVASELGETGVDHGVTAVLLAFRSLDTWMEIAVLLFALIALGTLLRTWAPLPSVPREGQDPLLSWFGRVIAPVAVLGAGFVLWLGTSEPGGAFQAGALLGALVIVLVLSGLASPTGLPPGVLRGLAGVGAAAFVVLAVVGALVEGRFLRTPPGIAGEAIVVVEVAIALSIGLGLAGLALAPRRKPR